MEVIEEKQNNAQVGKAFLRIVINMFIIFFDTFPGIAIPVSLLEFFNIITVISKRIGIKLPTLTPDVQGGIFGIGVIGGILDFITLELLPFPSSIFIHGAQILHDIRPIHEYVQQNQRLRVFLPITKFFNTISLKVLRKR